VHSNHESDVRVRQVEPALGTFPTQFPAFERYVERRTHLSEYARVFQSGDLTFRPVDLRTAFDSDHEAAPLARGSVSFCGVHARDRAHARAC
jgi:hypothetical protein